MMFALLVCGCACAVSLRVQLTSLFCSPCFFFQLLETINLTTFVDLDVFMYLLVTI